MLRFYFLLLPYFFFFLMLLVSKLGFAQPGVNIEQKQDSVSLTYKNINIQNDLIIDSLYFKKIHLSCSISLKIPATF